MTPLTTYEARLEDIRANVVDIEDFNERVVGAYNSGLAERALPADDYTARSVVPAGTGALRDFSYIAPDIPEFLPENCVGCMDCVTQCPDTAILGKVAEPATLADHLAGIPDESLRGRIGTQWAVTNKYFNVLEKKGVGGGKFGIFIDLTKCKGCAECVDACGDHKALRMIRKIPENLDWFRQTFSVYKAMPETPAKFINEKALSDMMLTERSLLYVGGAGSCMGCGEATALRMMLAATGFLYGQENVGIVAATGCNTVYTSTYPYNPYRVSWTNSLFENAPADAMGVRARWDQLGWSNKRLWIIGGDGAMNDIGFQSLSRMMASGADIKVLVLDTQVYSNTGGQASTSSFKGQDAKMSYHGSSIAGKKENRKELANICMMHKDV
ncbi:MAG: thiamine pyrophosphate-binding protein, partial [Chloroflexi bacterium]|nr:thiamine pyrophosphate-binding protein [Chloroflexota bacterium]